MHFKFYAGIWSFLQNTFLSKYWIGNYSLPGICLGTNKNKIKPIFFVKYGHIPNFIVFETLTYNYQRVCVGLRLRDAQTMHEYEWEGIKTIEKCACHAQESLTRAYNDMTDITPNHVLYIQSLFENFNQTFYSGALASKYI